MERYFLDSYRRGLSGLGVLVITRPINITSTSKSIFEGYQCCLFYYPYLILALQGHGSKSDFFSMASNILGATNVTFPYSYQCI